jgi:ABC-2 type transport system permease protein
VRDFWTIVWKELRDSVFSGRRSELIVPVLVIAIMGIIIPWQFGQSWISLSPAMMFIACYVPFYLTTSYVGDAVAGERERHTLETLLASRISDRAILWGKMAVAVAYVWGLTVIGLLLGSVVANLGSEQSHWEFYHPIGIFTEMFVLGLLASLLSASGGVLISLRASSVRQAQQTMAVGTLILMIALILILKSVPSDVLSRLNTSQILMFLIGGFAVLDLILVRILLIGFRRSNLILSYIERHK